MVSKRYLAIDLGQSKSGIAISDPTGLIASPLEIFKHINLGSHRDLANYVVKLVEEKNIQELVVGYPVNEDLTTNQKTVEVDRFILRLKNRLTIPINLQSEYHSTQKANEHIAQNYRYQKKIKTKDDAIAAAFILQAFLDER